MLIERLFDKNGIEYEKIPQNFLMNLWARKLKVAEFFRYLTSDDIEQMVVIIWCFNICWLFAFSNVFERLGIVRSFAVCLITILVMLYEIPLLLRCRRTTNAKYESRYYFRVDKDNAKRIDELNIFYKYGAKLSEFADDDSYILIVLEGAATDSSAYLLFPASALEKYSKGAVYFSKKKSWFETPWKSESKIIQEQQEKIDMLEEKLKNAQSDTAQKENVE